VYADSAFVAASYQGNIRKRESFFYDSGIDSDTFDKPLGHKLGGNRRRAVLQKIGKK
jgi:hypothetical protein